MKLTKTEQREIDVCIAKCRAALDDDKSSDFQKRMAQAGLDECERLVAEHHAA